MIPDHFRRVKSAIETGYHSDHVRAEALESLEEIRSRWSPGECAWELVEQRTGHYKPNCRQDHMVLKPFGSRFCCFCGSPLTLHNDY
jgi:hypothetical protein